VLPRKANLAGKQSMTGEATDRKSAVLARARAMLEEQTAPPQLELSKPSLRRFKRVPVQIRAVLYFRHRFAPVVIRDISRGGAGFESSASIHENDEVTLTLLNGRELAGRVRWWCNGYCGVQFNSALGQDDELLLHQRNARSG
jgi:PilZ domain-containing protein